MPYDIRKIIKLDGWKSKSYCYKKLTSLALSQFEGINVRSFGK